MILECANCGAPLDVKPGASQVKCAYCRQPSQIGGLKTVEQETPKGWRPPEQWKPPPGYAVQADVLKYTRSIGRVIGMVVASAAIIPIAVVGFTVYRVTSAIPGLPTTSIPDVNQLVRDQIQAATGQAMGSAGATGPISCGGGQELTITGKVLDAGTGTAVTAKGACKLHLVGCTLSGATAVSADGAAHVVITGGTFTGTGPALMASGLADVEVSGGASFVGERTISAVGNAKVRLGNAKVEGKSVAIFTANLAKVDSSGATLKGIVSGTGSKRR